MRVHDLKTESKYFRDVWEGKKKAELRKDDRGYEVGDGLMLWEYRDGKKTGSRQLLIVTHILRGVPEYGLKDGYCILSFEHAGEEQEVGSTVRALRVCAEGAPCSDCPQKPKKWNCELLAFHWAIRFCHLGLLKSSPDESPSSIRFSSCTTMRPAPMLRWPTSELP